ncbi:MULTISPECIES: sialidase family protein [Arthrobacter]|uniref:Sialidase family protein n=2 Tax=Arthrobacter TaxID=1663 RepID=A0ABU9KGB0_9MICC|nr:sialidase family protein [Arthrobacter sp. YJM1]MDP5225925.1 sialidase family protein [Arthrobacter sp. YJM1]
MTSHRLRAPALLALLPAALLLNMPGASAATVLPPVVVSGANPLSACTLGAAPGAINYLNAEVEPWVAVNPADPANIIGAWQQDRWSDGGAHGLVAGYSKDGGVTWHETPQPFSACAPGGPSRYDRASDPWVSIGPDGTAYSVSISFQGVGYDNAVLASTSRDGGATWSGPKALIQDLGSPQFFNDKESVTADPAIPGTAYAVWDRLVSPNGNPRSVAHATAYTGPTLYSKTTDFGATWSAPKVIVPTANKQQTIGNQIVVGPGGTLYNFFDFITGTGKNGLGSLHGTNVAYSRSTDGGTTWTAPQIIASLNTAGVTDPNTGAAIRTGDIIPEAAVDPVSGQLYVVWQDSRFNGGHYDEVALSTSTDGGSSWSAPTRVNTPKGVPAFNPGVSVAGGTVAVSYDDFRDLTVGNVSTLPTDHWVTMSPLGAPVFGNETRVAGPFDLMTAPNAGGFFLGDYSGLAALGSSFASLSIRANDGDLSNRTDAVFTVIAP